MGSIVAIGESVRVQGLALAGVIVLPGDSPAEVAASWSALPEGTSVVILTPRAAEALTEVPPGHMTVVMPP
jgi:vacuolar-type H+-ATPase subunit F/Vma7